MEQEDKKYPCQECQDDEINSAFRNLHHKLVDEIIKFCKNYNVEIDDFHLNADGVLGSIPYGQWQACTDSALTLSWNLSRQIPRYICKIWRKRTQESTNRC